VDPGTALRWRGRLRKDPLRLPWGQRFEIDLEQVEARGAALSTTGGLGVNFYPRARMAEPPAGLRAGDRVEVLVKARPPRDYLDPGAFDVKGFLALEKIDVMGSLRSGELLRWIDRPPPTISQRLARARGTLLARLDSQFCGAGGTRGGYVGSRRARAGRAYFCGRASAVNWGARGTWRARQGSPSSFCCRTFACDESSGKPPRCKRRPATLGGATMFAAMVSRRWNRRSRRILQVKRRWRTGIRR
jgi:hypothetical protein